ncbi:MAG: DsrE family protein [Bacteroidales bacterium]|nr:DsrE family protein [Bacteroidales bacterium]
MIRVGKEKLITKFANAPDESKTLSGICSVTKYTLIRTLNDNESDRLNQYRRFEMKVLIIFNREPYDNTDVTWNGLRLAETLRKTGQEVRIFLMNDSVDMDREACKAPEAYDQDLSQMLKDLISKGVQVKVCGTCMSRCGIYKNHPYFEGAMKSTMGELSEWVVDSDKVLTF